MQDQPPRDIASDYVDSSVPVPATLPLPHEEVFPIEKAFGHDDPYSIYNWELFFHVPLLIADRLRRNQRFEEARRWFHFIFDPTDGSPQDGIARFWKFLPFHREANSTKTIQEELSEMGPEMVRQITEWQNDPFNPHLIARLRHTAYQKTVVMKYIESLIAWGDQLFQRDTIESINEATQLYILAAEILGPRPQRLPRRGQVPIKTFDEINDALDPFSNALVELETRMVGTGLSRDLTVRSANGRVSFRSIAFNPPRPVIDPPRPPTIKTLCFCIPKNDQLLGYWDTVADRLFKIRHCMNIEGVVRELPLFEPPIDPALLVRAAAAGVDLDNVLNDLNAPLPHYRFLTMLSKATELCGEVRGLGAALLAALEKRDGEELALLRSSHEIQLLKAVREVKKQQIGEAKRNLEGLRRNRELVEIRRSYYQNVVAEGLSEHEHAQLDKLEEANEQQQEAMKSEIHAQELSELPNVTATVGFPSSSVGTTYGFSNYVAGVQAHSKALSLQASQLTYEGTNSSIMGGHQRRADDWKLQERLAAKELQQIDKQILASEIRLAIAEKDLENHDLQVENAKAVEETMRGKFTNQELYDWMVGQVSAIYFQSYQLALRVAKRAERAFRFELGLQDSDFVQIVYWDSLKKGLLAGDHLYHDLKRMDVAYLDQNSREYELTKYVNLLQVAPEALVRLRATGKCTFEMHEELFDMDGPGHYFRRIKSVAVSIPCVVGPYTSVNCKLNLQRSATRRSSKIANGGYIPARIEDEAFRDPFGSLQAIVTSSAQNDSGLFETNLRDERYLPFEGAGVISKWQLELSADPSKKEPCQFNYNTISDVILHIRYTAREGGSPLRGGAIKHLTDHVEGVGSVRLFSMRHEFPTEWAKFQSQAPVSTQRFGLALNLKPEHYPFWSTGRLNGVVRVDIWARSTAVPVPSSMDIFQSADPNDNNKKGTLFKDTTLGNLLIGPLTDVKFKQPNGNLEEVPTGELTIFCVDKAMSDLWVAVTWRE